MGYHATGSGSAVFKDNMTTDMIQEHFNNIDLNEYFNIRISNIGVNTDHKYIDFEESNGHWNEENTINFLNSLIPFIASGSIYYTGEDNSVWRYVFDPESYTWRKDDGIIDYNFESYTDEQMITELICRGYIISKNHHN